MRGPNGLEDLRGLQLIGAHGVLTPDLALHHPVQALMVEFLNQANGIVEHHRQHAVLQLVPVHRVDQVPLQGKPT
ncbi:hypothetical protein D3C76_757410 [compost metagenome]